MVLNTIEIFLKLFLACVLGGIIGLERESVNRPAGFRTHILVTVGATIVMITNMELVTIMASTAEVQPGRFGAAVISGIGFLGAGTIIREGSSVKGLTTAASLWATACIGLTLGTGLYIVAFGATAFVFLTLDVFPKIERKISKSKKFSSIAITVSDEIGQLSKISKVLEDLLINIKGIKTNNNKESTNHEFINITFKVKRPTNILESEIISKLLEIDGVTEVEVDSE